MDERVVPTCATHLGCESSSAVVDCAAGMSIAPSAAAVSACTFSARRGRAGVSAHQWGACHSLLPANGIDSFRRAGTHIKPADEFLALALILLSLPHSVQGHMACGLREREHRKGTHIA